MKINMRALEFEPKSDVAPRRKQGSHAPDAECANPLLTLNAA
jgi:hypothetical protein